MKKLQNLENFKKAGLHKNVLAKLTGGAQEGTVAGTACVNTELSATGCISYTSDTIQPGGGVIYHDTKDINEPCRD